MLIKRPEEPPGTSEGTKVLLIVAAGLVILFGGLSLSKYGVDSGHCVGDDECFLFRDDRLDALLALALGIVALWGRRVARTSHLVPDWQRASLRRHLKWLAVVGFGSALYVGLVPLVRSDWW